MTFNWIELAQALVLLLFPLGLALGKSTKLCTYSQLSDLDVPHWIVSWMLVPILWVDPLRAFLGTWFLCDAIALDPLKKGTLTQLPILLSIGVLVVALLVQIFVVRKAESMLAPLGFASGMLLAINIPMIAAVFSLILAIAGASAMRNWSAFFAIAAVTVVGFGFLFKGNHLWLVGTAALMMLPFVIGFISQREFVMACRN